MPVAYMRAASRLRNASFWLLGKVCQTALCFEVGLAVEAGFKTADARRPFLGFAGCSITAFLDVLLSAIDNPY